jgi:hypothetical protein
MAQNKVKAIPMTSINSDTFTGDYQPINSPNGLPNACFEIKIVNNSTKDVTVSYDGVTDHDYIPTVSGSRSVFQENASPASFVANMAQGTIVYVKATEAGTGFVYLTGYYSPQ